MEDNTDLNTTRTGQAGIGALRCGSPTQTLCAAGRLVHLTRAVYFRGVLTTYTGRGAWHTHVQCPMMRSLLVVGETAVRSWSTPEVLLEHAPKSRDWCSCGHVSVSAYRSRDADIVALGAITGTLHARTILEGGKRRHSVITVVAIAQNAHESQERCYQGSKYSFRVLS